MNAKPNTAPLIYYYSFLNLSKALCEMRNPRLNEKRECYAHGLSWRPNPRRMVRFEKEKVTIRGRGMWHLLWEGLTGRSCPEVEGTRLSIATLFSYCPKSPQNI